jgi:type III restriction enzyme
VKTPVIVGRKDDRTDALTKLTDGVTLLRSKEEAVAAYCARTGDPVVRPVMLVVAKDIDDADEYGAILQSGEFFGGSFADSVLVVHSKAPDEALAALAEVEDPESSTRIIISVGMLKEGWDVKNVYVIVSMRASVSEILTEQTLGRGMRLPFGKYTGVEILDTLEVVAHESYEKLLKNAGVLNQAFIDYRTWVSLRTDSKGQVVAVTQSTESPALQVVPITDVTPTLETTTPTVTTIETRAASTSASVIKLRQEVKPRDDAPEILVPLLRMSTVKSSFTLADITDVEPFRKLGRALASDPAGELSRTLFGARVVIGPDGVKRTELVRSSAADRIQSAPTLFSLDQLRVDLVDLVLSSPSVPARASQRAAVAPLIVAFMDGLGSKAEEVLSANLERAGARLIRLVADEQRRYMAKPSYEEVVEQRRFEPVRVTDRDTTVDRLGPFSKSIAYEGWNRSMFPLVWFDSEPERRVANMLDDDASIATWIRLHTNDLPILWNSEGRQYNPDFIAIDTAGHHLIVEVKMDKEVDAADVVAKREAAKRWANHVNADDAVTTNWSYVLLSESDITTSKGSWPALLALGGS